MNVRYFFAQNLCVLSTLYRLCLKSCRLNLNVKLSTLKIEIKEHKTDPRKVRETPVWSYNVLGHKAKFHIKS